MYLTFFLSAPFVITELLSDDYIFVNKLKVSSKTDDGFSYTITGVQNLKQDTIDAEVNGKFKVKGATLTGNLFTGGKLPTAELKYETLDSSGRKFTLCGTAGNDIAVASAEVLAGPIGVKGLIDTKNSNFYGSAAFALSSEKYDGFAVVGTEATYNTDEKQVMTSNYAVSLFDGKESECTLHVLDKAKKGMISYSHHVRPGFSVGGQMTYVRETKETALAMGTALRMDGATTIKAKLDSEGSLALSYIQDIRPNTTLIMSSMFNTKTFDSAKVGISLTVE